MSKFNIKDFFKKNWVHFFAIGLFLIITFIYFAPQFNGYSLEQHDIKQFAGMSHEIVEHRAEYAEEPLWTNSMFGGMPATQISQRYDGNIINSVKKYLALGISGPAGIFFLYMLGFYIMLMCMKVNKWVAIFGALAFAFSSYLLIILQAGHNSKAMAIALAPPVIGAFYMAFRSNLKWGLLLSALFMSMEIGANHLQITYYLGFALLFLGVSEIIRVAQGKTNFKKFGITTLGLLGVYLFAALLNYGNISMTNDYAKHTIRGANEISVMADGTSSSSNATSGLDKDYITQWSNGISETMTLISPNVKGGGTAAINNSIFKDKLKSKEFRKTANQVGKNNSYWGDQPFVTGPVYIGAFVIFLALMSLIYLKDAIRWGLLGATALCIFLSWGKNFMGFTDFFLEYLPGYNKFRAVTIILAIVELIIPLLGVLFLNKLIQEKEHIKNNLTPLYIGTGAMVVILLIFNFGTSRFLSTQEAEYVDNVGESVKEQILSQDPAVVLQQYKLDVNDSQQLERFVQSNVDRVDDQFGALEAFRKSVFNSSNIRSILFILLAAGAIILFVKTSLPKELLIGILAVLVLIDLAPVSLNYLSSEKGNGSKEYKYWVENVEKKFPYTPTASDREVMKLETQNNPELLALINAKASDFENAYLSENNVSKRDKRKTKYKNVADAKRFAVLNQNTNYRVYEPSGGFSSSRASYFHKSIGGYHGAKLRKIQNVFDFQIVNSNYRIFDIMNVKYFLTGNKAQINPNAKGNVWFAKNVTKVDTPEKELRYLGTEGLIKNESNYDLLINNEKSTEAFVYGLENVKYVINKLDTVNLDIKKALNNKVPSTFVSDVNGKTNWIPNSALAMDTLNSFKKLFSLNITHDFDPNNEVIVQNNTNLNDSYTANGSIELEEYRANYLSYKVNTDSDQFAVFSEVYYPEGWKAFIDGKEAEIKQANYFLRGLEIPAGAKMVEMKFELESFKMVNTLSLILGLIIIGLLIFFGFLDLKKKK